MKPVKHITPAKTDVYDALGLSESENLRLRAQLMEEIRRYIKEHKLYQREAATLMNTTQPRISDVMKDRVEKCSLDWLVRTLAAVGRHVNITVKDQAA